MHTAWNNAARELRPLVSVMVALMLLTTVAYPLAVTGVGQLFFHRQANGSIISINGTDVGSSLIGQQFSGDAYFQGRPSAAGAGYDASNSSGSNLGPTSAKLIESIQQRAADFRAANGLSPTSVLPADSVTASGSGLDPQISPATALLQASRVAKARGVPLAAIISVINQDTDGREFGFIGQPRVNVLELNIALDARFPAPK